jgi:hypothetical protein
VALTTVLFTSLPRVILNDGYNAPDRLGFEVQPEWLPSSMYRAALLLVEDHERFILKGVTPLSGAGTLDTGGRRAYYVLSSSQNEYHKISHQLITRSVLSHK